MHELSLAEGVLQLVEETARREGAVRVTTVVVEIGQLASVEPDALAFCFEAVSRGGLAQGADLEIIRVAGEGWCPACAASVPMAALWGICPRCGGDQVRPTGGTAMRVKEIEIE